MILIQSLTSSLSVLCSTHNLAAQLDSGRVKSDKTFSFTDVAIFDITFITVAY